MATAAEDSDAALIAAMKPDRTRDDIVDICGFS